MDILQPPDWARPRGYVNGIVAHGTLVSVAGQIGWNAQGQFESDDLVAQVRQALANVVAVLAQAGAEPQHLVRLTWYLTDKREYLARAKEIGAVYRELIRDPFSGPHYPVMTAVQVSALIEDRAKVEIEATAVLPPPPPRGGDV
jgi:enamine deaminase RidA (YjgF/YER057c/UK114 family)